MRILLIALLAVAALPAAADAATLSRTGGTLRYAAAKGERISAQLAQSSDGGFVARRAKNVRQRLAPGAGCRRSGAREVRCAGRGVTRVEIALKRARMSKFWVEDVHVAVAAVGSKGANTLSFTRTPTFTYDGGPKQDDVVVRDTPGGHSTIRLGAGTDFFDGQPPSIGAPDSPATFTVDGGSGSDALMGGPAADSLDGGPGADSLFGGGGADTLSGGPGSDTATFSSFVPGQDDGPISVTLDGQRNDGTPGQNALVGSDIENATIGDTASPTDDVLVGNDGPNVLMGPGTVRGLGGNDAIITNNLQGTGTTLDGGDGDDRIDALAFDTASGSPATTSATVVCGAGSDVVFTNAAVPADCERANVGMHVRGARPIGRKGVVRARIGCNDPHGCVLGRVTLKLHGHQAGLRTTRIAIPFGASRIASVQIAPRIWKRHRHARSLRMVITPFPQPTLIPSPAVSTGAYPRTLTVRIAH